jgi:hypothetical protein
LGLLAVSYKGERNKLWSDTIFSLFSAIFSESATLCS